MEGEESCEIVLPLFLCLFTCNWDTENGGDSGEYRDNGVFPDVLFSLK